MTLAAPDDKGLCQTDKIILSQGSDRYKNICGITKDTHCEFLRVGWGSNQDGCEAHRDFMYD